MKRVFLLAALAGVASSAIAEGLTTKIEGMFLFETALRKQGKLPAENKNLSSEKKNVAISSEARFGITASGETDAMKYGAKIDLITTTQPNTWASFNGSHIFTESDYGKWQFGSAYDAGSQMRLTGFEIAKGTGDNWTNYAFFDPRIEYAWVDTPGASILAGNYKKNAESSRKVTYFTPKFMDKVQLGVSYIPDATNVGDAGFSDRTSKKARVVTANGVIYSESPGVKDAVSVGATFEQNLSDCMNLKVAVTGEFGKSSKKGDMSTTAAPTVVTRSYKIDGMRTYNIGAALNCGAMSFAGSYSDLGKSLMSKEVDGVSKRKTRYYTLGAAYTQGPVGVSLAYARGERLKNKMNSYTLGTDYKLAPGFVPYVELTYFQGKGQKLPVYNDNTKVTRKGTVALIGATLKF